MAKTIRTILLFFAMITAQWVSSTELSSSDPYWIGANSAYGSTEGNDFWVTFMRNGGTFDPETSQNIKFELKIAVSARQDTRIYFAIPGMTPIMRNVQAGQTHIEDLSTLFAQIYLIQSEVAGLYKGVHVYTDESNKSFSCFNYSRYGEAGVSSRDATLIIPTEFMGKEYYVQTYYEDAYSSQFAIVATEDNTVVNITPAYQTLTGQPAGVTYTVTLLHAGDAYMVASAAHQENQVNVDLSGSQICANKPVAVFNGNQETSIPFHESNSVDYLSEQILPVTQWGTDFYLALLANTKQNYFILTAAYNDTHITINSYSADEDTTYPETITLQAGETLEPYYIDDDLVETTIHSDKPIMCYAYTTSASKNEQCTGTSPRNKLCYYYGDPANALMPSWAHRVTEMNFFTHDLDPFQEAGKPVPPQKYYVFVITKWADRDKLTIDGTGDFSAQFHPFHIAGDEDMAYASIEVTNNSTTHYHTIETTGDGFVGMVYAVTDAQGYLYTLGYSPEPFRDSLFVTNTGNVMSPKSYDVQPRLEQGWYQRQWNEWVSGHERIDTAQICDGDSITWLLQSAISKQTEPVDWYIYDVTGTEQTIHKSYTAPIAQKEGATKDEATNTDWLYRWGHKFVMPDESDLPPEERTPFMEYEIQAVMHQKHVICDLPDDLDTLRTVVRVTRVYHDTIYRIICMGDTLKCFKDSLPRQNAHNNDSSYLDDLPQYRTNSRHQTLFIADKTTGPSTTDFQWKARAGENTYTRHYETIYGCDSTYTLFLFVCDTFRTVDTLHLCKNEALTYLADNPALKKKYKGIEYEGDGILVTQDTVDIIKTKTRFCPCQVEPYKGIYPAFKGCDSIFEVHILLCDIPRDTLVDTMCYNRAPDSVYSWSIQRGTQEIHITKNHPNMQYHADLRAWIGFFSDTLRTINCAACNDGRGCDSIQVLKLIIPEPFYKEEKDSLCLWTYDKTTRQKYTNIYQWEGHRNGAAYVDLPQGGVYYDSCVTRFGCDSIYRLELHYIKPFLHVDWASIANNQTYTWHGQTYGPFPELKDVEDTTLFFHNDNEPQIHPLHGCDSIYRLDLHISDTYLFRSSRAICDIDSLHWRDTVIVGSKWQGTGSFDIRLSDSLTTTIDDSLTTIALPARDSIYRLIVTQYPTYDTTLHCVNICQDQTVYNWVREDDGTLIQRIVLPVKTNYPFDTIYTDTLPTKTPLACDSILHLPIRIYPTYDTTTTVVLCESDLPFLWELRDEAVHDTLIDIPASDRGTLWHYTQDYVLHTPNGCDSTVHLDLTVKPVLRRTIVMSLCPETMPYTYGTHGRQATVTGIYNDTTTSILYGCDSITTYDITVFEKIEVDVYQTVCDDRLPYTYEENDTVPVWQGLTESGDYTYVFRQEGRCDSTVTLHLTINPVRRVTIERRTCQNAMGYEYENLHNGAGGTLPARFLSDSLTRIDTIPTALGCDSIITLHFFVDSVYSYTRKDTVCQQIGGNWIWYEDGVPQDTISLDKGDTTWLLGTRYQTIHGCDSTYGIEIYIAPIYHIHDTATLCESDSLQWQGMLFTGSEYANYGQTYDPTLFDSTQIALTAGIYDYAVPRSTVIGCDSVHHLHLTINPVRRVTIERRTCQNAMGYEYENLHNGAGGTLPARFLSDSLTRIDTIPTALGCDSIITLHFFVDSVYDYRQSLEVCQDTINTQWEWIDDEGHSHGFIDISQSGHYSFDEAYTTIHGCDSLYGLKLYVKPVYRFDSAYVICENEELRWQGRLYSGLSVGMHYDTARYTTYEGCDSTYYMQVLVHPVFDTVSYFHTCTNETFIWHQEDMNGAYDRLVWDAAAQDTIFLSVSEAAATAEEVPHLKYLKDTTMIYRDTTLQTIHHCDSVSRLWLTVHPSYFYYTDTTICATEKITYRGKVFPSREAKDTTYTERIKTADGCDSIYQLHLHIKPAFLYTRIREICDNETLIFPEDGRKVWAPGDPIPQKEDYIDFTYTTSEGCDSTYRYFVTVHPTFYQEREETFCSGDSVLIQGDHYVGINTIYDAYSYHLPVDTVFTDSLSTVHGCDSVFRIHAHILPQYYHLDSDTICDNGQITWHGQLFDNVAAGLHIAFDSLKTHADCDSVFELRLYVMPTYYNEETITKCADEALTWRGHNLDHQAVGEFLIYDSLHTSFFGCDSVFHLHLTVLDTTNEVIHDTICRTELYDFHGVILNEPGYYYDTTLNDWGCHHFTHLFLEVIEPIVPTAWADSICADDQAYDLHYTYTGDFDPIAYSVYYDEVGHSYGFEDIIDAPIITREELSVLSIPMPLRGEDKTKYPKPDYYPIRLVLDNGICTTPELCDTDTSIVLSYPSWITEQRFGDVIALYNDRYNGGYQWDEFQWFHGDELLVGETHEYLYVPTGLIVGDQYYVRLTRTGEKTDFQTCPITIVGDPISNDYAPKMGYLSVVPTCIVTGHPYANILSRKDGMFRVTSSEGRLVTEGVFRADVTEVALPPVSGLYIFQLWSPDTPEEPYRSIKVIVKEKCENCNIPF